jgi:tripartite-type tricarboxylate transporter receptor subunit TctC
MQTSTFLTIVKLRTILPAARLLAGALMLLASGLAAAQYPERPVKLVVPATAGDGSDLLARALAKSMGDALGQPFVVDNRPGAGGSIGANIVAKAPANGYTLFLANGSSHGVTPGLYAKLPYDSIQDFSPIALIATAPNVLVVNAAQGPRTYAEFVQLARSQPGKVTIASAGSGSISHLSAELLKSSAGIDLLHVPYKGAAPAMSDLLGGQAQAMIINIPTVLPLIRSGKLRALAATSAKRAAELPDVPTLAESGLTGYETVAWFGLLAPAHTPANIVQLLQAQVQKSLLQPEIRGTLSSLGAEASTMSARDFPDYIKSEIAKYSAVIKSAGIKIE